MIFWNCINNSKTLVEYILLYHMKNLDLSKNIDKKIFAYRKEYNRTIKYC